MTLSFAAVAGMLAGLIPSPEVALPLASSWLSQALQAPALPSVPASWRSAPAWESAGSPPPWRPEARPAELRPGLPRPEVPRTWHLFVQPHYQDALCLPYRLGSTIYKSEAVLVLQWGGFDAQGQITCAGFTQGHTSSPCATKGVEQVLCCIVFVAGGYLVKSASHHSQHCIQQHCLQHHTMCFCVCTPIVSISFCILPYMSSQFKSIHIVKNKLFGNPNNI